MSTEFVTTTTDETAFCRFCRTSESGHRTSFEFGSMTNFENVLTAVDRGETFSPLGSPLDSDPEFTREGLEEALVQGRVTFGEFPFTLELGSGDSFRLFTER